MYVCVCMYVCVYVCMSPLYFLRFILYLHEHLHILNRFDKRFLYLFFKAIPPPVAAPLRNEAFVKDIAGHHGGISEDPEDRLFRSHGIPPPPK